MEKDAKKISKKNIKIDNKSPKRKSKQKGKKSKEKVEKQIIFAPKTRLEPRLNFPSSEKNKSKTETGGNIEKDKRLVISLNANEVEDHLKRCSLKDASHLNSPSSIRSGNEKSLVPVARNISLLKNESPRASLRNIENYFGDDEDLQNFIKQSRQRSISKGLYWTDREIKDLAYALQSHGFSDPDKLATEVKTKTANDIKVFLKARTVESRKAKTSNFEPEKQRGRPRNSWTTVTHEALETWPSVRKWRRLAYEQMLAYTRSKDYSKPVISALCNKFYEEEPEPSDPQLINVKLIYKYISDCMAGVIPPQLPPKESAVVLDLLREVRLMPIAYDFEEERQFLKGFRKATTFKPFQVKDEFKKKIKEASGELDDPNTVSVPEEVFLELSRHKRLLQSFNPLITPVWMVQKEQEHLEKYFEETSVYVD